MGAGTGRWGRGLGGTPLCTPLCTSASRAPTAAPHSPAPLTLSSAHVHAGSIVAARSHSSPFSSSCVRACAPSGPIFRRMPVDEPGRVCRRVCQGAPVPGGTSWGRCWVCRSPPETPMGNMAAPPAGDATLLCAMVGRDGAVNDHMSPDSDGPVVRPAAGSNADIDAHRAIAFPTPPTLWLQGVLGHDQPTPAVAVPPSVAHVPLHLTLAHRPWVPMLPA